MKTDGKIIDDFFRSHGFNPSEREEDKMPIDNATQLPSGYDVMILALHHHAKLSTHATDHAIDWLLHFNRAARVAFTLPLSLSEAHTGINITQDEAAGPQ